MELTMVFTLTAAIETDHSLKASERIEALRQQTSEKMQLLAEELGSMFPEAKVIAK